MKGIILLTAMFIVQGLLGQKSFRLEGTISGFGNKKVMLADFYGERNHVLDSTVTDTSGYMQFAVDAAHPEGMIRIILKKNEFIDLIFGHEDIAFRTAYPTVIDSLQIITSEENRLYYGFLDTKRDFRIRFELLNPLVDYYPRSDTFYESIREKYENIQLEFISETDRITAEHQDSYAAKMIALQKPPFLDPALNENERFEYLKDHFFDDKDLTELSLLRSTAYTNLAIDYISLFSNPRLKQEELEAEMMKAVDEIMYRFLDNEIVYDFIVEYLVGGFERFHFDKVLDHIAQNYAPEQCENEDRKTDLETRLKKYAELAVGKKAPDIRIPDMENNMVTLSGLESDHVLVLFWASWCPHCTEVLPRIGELYADIGNRKMEVLAISLDTNREEWEAALPAGNYSWINAADLKGWDGEAALKYNVYATPTMFLLDGDMEILAKPISFSELESALTDAGLL